MCTRYAYRASHHWVSPTREAEQDLDGGMFLDAVVREV